MGKGHFDLFIYKETGDEIMKKLIAILMALFVICGYAFAEGAIRLDKAIDDISDDLARLLPFDFSGCERL